MKKMISFISFISFGTYAFNDEVVIKKGEILVHHHNINQVLQYDVEPDFLKYKYRFVDLNKDHQLDLIIIEINEPNNTSIVFNKSGMLFSKKPNLYDDIRLSKKFNCAFSEQNITLFYPDKLEKISNNDKKYNLWVERCVKLSSIYN